MSDSPYKHKMYRKADPGGPPDRTRYATVSLFIGAAMFILAALLLGVFYFSFDGDENTLWRTGSFSLAGALFIGSAVASLVVARALRRRRQRAWRAAIVVFIVLYLPNILLPVGLAGLYGLMSAGTRAKFSGPSAHREGARRKR